MELSFSCLAFWKATPVHPASSREKNIWETFLENFSTGRDHTSMQCCWQSARSVLSRENDHVVTWKIRKQIKLAIWKNATCYLQENHKLHLTLLANTRTDVYAFQRGVPTGIAACFLQMRGIVLVRRARNEGCLTKTAFLFRPCGCVGQTFLISILES